MDPSIRYMDLLPEELITDEVLMRVQYPDLLNFCQTSERAARICQDEFFWKRKVRRDLGTRFPGVNRDIPQTGSWKEEYKQYFKILVGRFDSIMYQPYAQPHWSEVKELLEFGMDPNKRRNGTTPLIRAARRNQPMVIKELIKAGADINDTDDDGFTPLMIAALNGYFEAMNALIDTGADVKASNPKDGNKTAFMYAQDGLATDSGFREEDYLEVLGMLAMKSGNMVKLWNFYSER